jgi:hypothetical protein
MENAQISVGEIEALMQLYKTAKVVWHKYTAPLLPFNPVSTKEEFVADMEGLGSAIGRVESLLDW